MDGSSKINTFFKIVLRWQRRDFHRSDYSLYRCLERIPPLADLEHKRGLAHGNGKYFVLEGTIRNFLGTGYCCYYLGNHTNFNYRNSLPTTNCIRIDLRRIEGVMI